MRTEFSIITPCGYRDKHRILDLEKSLNTQTYKNFEWIITCNDPSFNIGKESFPRYVVAPTKNTVSDARNEALRVAEGKYIIFIDADDYLKPNALLQLYNIIQRYQNDSYIFDLNPYITYEPYKAFKLSIKDFNKDLPEWNNLNNSHPNDINKYAPKSVKQYRKLHHILEWKYSGQNKYYNLSHQLMCEGKVIPQKLIRHYQFKFPIHQNFYSNIPFMMQTLINSSGIVRLNQFNYIMVWHNDPINDPSLSELIINNKMDILFKAFINTLNISNNKKQMTPFIRWSCTYIESYLYKELLQDGTSTYSNRDKALKNLQKYLTECQDNFGYNISAKPLKLIKSGDFKRALRAIHHVYNLRMAHKLVNNHGRGITKAFYFKYYLHLPIKQNVITFESFLGRNYSDNPKYIFLYIHKKYGNKFHYIWIADAKHYQHIKQDLNNFSNTNVVKRFGFKYMKYMAISKYFVFNMRQPQWIVKRPNTKFLETWHGTPLKHLVFDMNDVSSASKLYKEIFYHQSRHWDNLIADNSFSCKIFNKAFMYPTNKIIKTGYPRNDILYSKNQGKLRKRIKLKLGIPLNKKVILYAPTWRDNHYYAPGQYEFKLHLNLKLLQQKLSKNYVLILRTHYFIANHIDTSAYKGFVYNESNYDDISELYLISDILITDYSSVFFDYANLRRPILFYVYDYDSYASVLRGFYLNMKQDLPGPLLKTSQQVVSAIKNIDDIQFKYQDKYQEFNRKFNSWDNGQASSKAVHYLFK